MDPSLLQERKGVSIMQSVSLFGQLLQHFPKSDFYSLVKKHSAERYAKGFGCWTQFVSMMFCHLARADSLRQICDGLSGCLGKLNHLGIAEAPARSTLSYANANRPAELYQDLFYDALTRFRADGRLGARRPRFRFKNRLLSLDSTTISLCLELFPWAKFRRAKGGVKAHVLLDHDDYMPAWVLISNASCHDIKATALLNLPADSIIAIDRGYNDYGLFGDLTRQGVYFVIRMKDNAVYRVIERRDPPQHSNVRSDELIELTGVGADEECPFPLRRIVIFDAENDREIVILTNHLTFGATTVAAIYKDRWAIELFFKALKQNLKVKTFVGTTPNALQIQIWTALIALLLLKWLHHLSKAGWSLANMAAMLRLNLFTYRDLASWLENPSRTPPIVPGPIQLPLFGPALGQVTP